MIEQQRPAGVHLLDVGAGERRSLEGDHNDRYVEINEGPLVLLQLQQVPSAR